MEVTAPRQRNDPDFPLRGYVRCEACGKPLTASWSKGRSEDLTLAQMDRHASELEEMDVEGILAFAERGLPSGANLWVQASLDQKQRLQQLFFPESVGFDGKRLVRTGVTLPAFNHLAPADGSNERSVDQISASSNQIVAWQTAGWP